MQKNIIFYIGGFEMPDKNAASIRVTSNAKILKSLNYEVVFIGISRENNFLKKENHNGFESWTIPYPKNIFSWLTHITSIKKLLEIIGHIKRDKILAIICYNFPSIPLLKIQKYCKRNNIFQISDTTEWYSNMSNSMARNFVKHLDTTLRMRFVQFQSDGLITTSKYLTNFYSNKVKNIVEIPTLFDSNISRSFNQEKKIKFIYAGVPFDRNLPLNKRHLIKDRLDKVVVMFSKLGRKKNNFILNIFGLTKIDYLKVFPEHECMLDDNIDLIRFHGRVSNTIIKQQTLLSDFSVFIRNIDRTIEAGFPTKFSESISMGTPVICNRISCIDDYMFEGKNCFEIDKDSEKKQFQKLSYILSMKKNSINQMKSFCINNNIFHFKNYIKKLELFINSLS